MDSFVLGVKIWRIVLEIILCLIAMLALSVFFDVLWAMVFLFGAVIILPCVWYLRYRMIAPPPRVPIISFLIFYIPVALIALLIFTAIIADRMGIW